MKLSRVMIAAPKSGSGKTSITCGLLSALKGRGMKPVSYKCGPDYIDTMFHKTVLGIPSKNLDTFFTDEKTTINLMLEDRQEDEFALIEGVMGLYDGLGGVREEGSSYHLAKITKTPIVLVVDAKGMGKSLLALISGFLSYDSEKLIKGVILNRMSKGYYDTIAPLIEEELGIKVIGYVPDKMDFELGSRHLGLILPDEIDGIATKLNEIGKELEATLDINKLIEIGQTACDIPCDKATQSLEVSSGNQKPVIAVAYDQAFCFYYEDNINLFRKFGAEIKYFSPINDRELPEGTSAIVLGGGYPENYLEELSSNSNMLEAIRSANKEGLIIIAECGGFMYLHESITNKDGKEYKMAGILPGGCVYKNKLVRFGYIELNSTKASSWISKESIKGHEFHYFDCDNNGDDFLAVKPVTGKTYPCIINKDNVFAGFPHLYYPSNPAFARCIVDKAAEYQSKVL